MNEKEVGELRRRLRPEKNSITHIRGCYVNEMGESVAQFDQSLALMTQEETETLLALLRRTLSGTLGKNLLDLSFETRQVVEGEEHRRPAALSGGMRRRLALVRCLALSGKLYLLDEPFTGIDPERTKRLMDFLRELGTPVLLSSHETQVLSLADQVVQLDGYPLHIL